MTVLVLVALMAILVAVFVAAAAIAGSITTRRPLVKAGLALCGVASVALIVVLLLVVRDHRADQNRAKAEECLDAGGTPFRASRYGPVECLRGRGGPPDR